MMRFPRLNVIFPAAPRRVSGGFCVWALLGAIGASAAEPAHEAFFEKKIRPLLAENCFKCHGEEKQKGGLRLDSRAEALIGGDLGPAFVPGHAEQSRLIEAVRYTNEDLQMPPKKRLSPTEIADLTTWIDLGAPWPGADLATANTAPRGEMAFTAEQTKHWAWQTLTKPVVPRPKNDAWCRTDVDRFILARLEAAGLAPVAPAAPAVFLRRLTFDLTGLPPTPEELQAFIAESIRDPQSAIRNHTTRLLASPHHGERYARHWLDVARYADSNGSEIDHAMANAWRYRDYVVRAFNDDKPYDRFVREQLAGDLLPGADTDTVVATGFIMLGPKALADLDKPKLAADIIDEQVDTVTRAFMGVTLACARCHDHKFDPLPTADYYALAGIFQSTRTMVDLTRRVVTWHERPLDTADAPRVEALAKRIADLKTQRDAAGSGRPVPALPAGGKFLLIEAEDFTRGNVRVDDDQLGRGIGVVRTRMEYPDRIEYEFDLPEAGQYQLELRYAAKESRPTELSINGNIEETNAAAEVTGDWIAAAQRWFVQGSYKFRDGRNKLVLQREGPVPLFDKLLIGRPSAEPHSREVSERATTRSVATHVDTKKLDADTAAAQRELEAIPTVMAPAEGAIADAPILIRGSPASPGAIVPRGFARVVGDLGVEKPGAAQSGRLELAHWLTHPMHPLTARVIVNRVWLWHFGEGLVRSPDNFGLRGEKPSHPELLDWLAAWFVENGWSLKKLHTLICNSAVYRQSAVVSGPGTSATADPENRLLSHFLRRRLSAEELHDAMLAVSGQLDRTLGGTLMQVPNRTYVAGGTAPPDIEQQMHYDAPRRALYLPIIRNALHDFFATFNYPDPGMLTGQRAQTTVAPQALFLMNSPFVLAQARALAERVQPLGDDDATRVRAAYLLAFARPPNAGETDRALAFLTQERLTADDAKASAKNKTADSPWARFCHALLSSNEFFYLR